MTLNKVTDAGLGSTQLTGKADKTYVDAQIVLKVDKVTGKGLSTNDYDNTEKSQVATISSKADKSYVDTQISSVASGSPKGTYATLTALQAAFPTGNTNIYVVTADGKWYYWSGSAWTAGGVYQGTGVTKGSITQNELSDQAVLTRVLQLGKNVNLFDNRILIQSGFVDTNGTISAPNAGFVYTDKVYLVSNTLYTITADWKTLGEQYKLHFYKADGTHISYATGTTSTGATFTTPLETNYCRITFPTPGNYLNTMIVFGNVAPTSYIPYGASFDFMKLYKPISSGDLDSAAVLSRLLQKGKNLNLYNSALPLISGYVDINGTLVSPNSGFVYTDKTYLIPNVVYTVVADWATLGEPYKLHFFKSDDTHISYATGTTSTGVTFTAPTDTSYCRLSFQVGKNYNNTMIVFGSVAPASFISYGAEFDFLKLPSTTFDGVVKSSDISFVNGSRNLFNKAKIITGKEVYGDGSIRDYPNYPSAITEYIPVTGSDLYVSGLMTYTAFDIPVKYAAFYDANKVRIGSMVQIDNTLTEKYIPISPGAVYFVLSVYQRKSSAEVINIDSLQIELSATKTAFVPYTDYVSQIQGKKLYVQSATTSLKTEGKNILIFGDSISETATVSDDGSIYTEGTRSNWAKFSKSSLKLGQMWNYAKSGASYRDRHIEPRQFIGQQISSAIANNRPADIIVVSCGTNDGSSSIGSYDTAMGKATLNDLDTTLLYEAIRWDFWTLRQNYPNAICFAATPLQRADREPLTVLSNAIKQMANRYNFIVIDAEYESGIVKEFEVWNASGRYLSDGLHPGTNGQILMSKLFNRVILNSLNDANL